MKTYNKQNSSSHQEVAANKFFFENKINIAENRYCTKNHHTNRTKFPFAKHFQHLRFRCNHSITLFKAYKNSNQNQDDIQ